MGIFNSKNPKVPQRTGGKASQKESYANLAVKAAEYRLRVFEMAVRAHSGHISTAFSQMEMLVALYFGRILRYDPQKPKWPDRDRFILSKGQGGIGLYPILSDVGFFPLSEVENFAGKDSILGVHADWGIPGIEIITGSLGHGLPMATGMAQVGKIDKKDWLVYCLLGDGELYEGSNWEAAFYASHKKLSNIVCIVDRNGQGTIGYTDKKREQNDGPGLNPLDAKFESFGFETREINGHSFDEIFRALTDVRERAKTDDRPLVIISNTKKGKGLALMEDKRLWHYRVPTGDDEKLARAELTEGLERAKHALPMQITAVSQ